MQTKLRFSVLALVLMFSFYPIVYASGVAAQQEEQAKKPPFELHKIADGVYAAIAVRDGNSGFVVGDDGVAVIDTFTTADSARLLLEEIRKITPLPIRFVVNTHYHLDHTGGNGVFAAAGATIVAHRNVRAWARSENLKFFGTNPKPEQKAMVESIALPTVVYDNQIELFLGSRRLMVRHLAGHTGGDSIVEVPDAKIVFCGDLLWKTHIPNLIDASTAPWIETLNRLANDYSNAIFVPGHGDIAAVADVRVFRDYLIWLRETVAKAQADGKSGDALVEAVMPALKEKYGTWSFFAGLAKPDILLTAQELTGKKRLPGMPMINGQ